MKLSTFFKTIQLAMISLISVSVVVACGPDKRKHRMPMKVGQKGIDPKTGLPVGGGQTPEQQKKAAEDLKNRSGNISNIEGRIAQTKNGQPTDKNSMGEGTYTLDGVITYFKYMNTSNKSADMRVYREHGFQAGRLTDKEATLATGLVPTFSDNPRHIEALTSFTVDRTRNQDWSQDISNYKGSIIIRTQVTAGSNKFTHDLDDTLQGANPNEQLRVSVINLLLTGTFKDNAYTLIDEQKKTVTMRLLKVSDSIFKISFDIDESANPLQARTVVLTYKVEKATGGAAAPATGGAQAGQQPAPTTSTGMTPAETAPAPAASQPAADPAAAQAAPAPAGAPQGAIPGFDDDQSRQAPPQ